MDIRKELERELKQLDNLFRIVTERIKHEPGGSLHIHKTQQRVQYYQIVDGPDLEKKQRIYLKQEDLPLIKALAQKQYDQKMIQLIMKQRNLIEKFLMEYNMEQLKDLYTILSPERKELIHAEIVDDEEYCHRWLDQHYLPGTFEEGTPEYYTRKKERVRSKTEKIIADTYDAAEIPYLYEFPIQFKDGRIWRADFKVLNKRKRTEFIHEHLGMMDDIDYCNKAIGKIQTYMQNGYFPGKNLILTFESSQHPFSTKDLDCIIQEYFL